DWRYHYLYTTALARVAAIEKLPRRLRGCCRVRAGVLWDETEGLDPRARRGSLQSSLSVLKSASLQNISLFRDPTLGRGNLGGSFGQVIVAHGAPWICGSLVGNAAERPFVGAFGLFLASDLCRRFVLGGFPGLLHVFILCKRWPTQQHDHRSGRSEEHTRAPSALWLTITARAFSKVKKRPQISRIDRTPLQPERQK